MEEVEADNMEVEEVGVEQEVNVGDVDEADEEVDVDKEEVVVGGEVYEDMAVEEEMDIEEVDEVQYSENVVSNSYRRKRRR